MFSYGCRCGVSLHALTAMYADDAEETAVTLQADAAYILPQEPTAYLGPGRPLGFMYNRQGHLIFCDSLKVPCQCPCRCRTGYISWMCRMLMQDARHGECECT